SSGARGFTITSAPALALARPLSVGGVLWLRHEVQVDLAPRRRDLTPGRPVEPERISDLRLGGLHPGRHLDLVDAGHEPPVVAGPRRVLTPRASQTLAGRSGGPRFFGVKGDSRPF